MIEQDSIAVATSLYHMYQRLLKEHGGIAGHEVTANIPWNREQEREINRWKTLLILFPDELYADLLPLFNHIALLIARYQLAHIDKETKPELYQALQGFVQREDEKL